MPAPPLIERIAPGLGTLVGLGHVGFGARGLGAQVFGIWGDAHPSQVQAVRIPSLVMEWLLTYGKREPSHGAVRASFDKRSRKEMARDMGKPLIGQVGQFLSASLVVDPHSDRVITVMWKH